VRAELAAADARYEVLRAAEAWRAAGAIDGGELAAIRERYPDDRQRSRRAFRVLFFFLTLLAGNGIWGFSTVFMGPFFLADRNEWGHALLLGCMAAGSAFAARHAIAARKLRGFGVEEGLVALALGFQVSSFGMALAALDLHEGTIVPAIAAELALVCALVAWRWGIPATGALAALALFFALGFGPWPRALWLGMGAGLALAARRFSRRDASAVAHRRRADEVFVVAVVALYLALHSSNLGGRMIAAIPWRSGSAAAFEGAELAAAWFAMVALPALLAGLGILRRERLELGLGLLLALATGTSAVDALDLEPAWAVLLAAGALIGGLALLVRRILKRAPARTAGGFTDAPLYEAAGEGSWLELAASLAAFAPAPRKIAEGRAFEGGGGEFGGGGASTKF
jgi:hypothetical protein